MQETLKDAALDQPLFSLNTGRAVLSIAPEVLGGEIAAARKDYDAAITHLERAVRYEDALVYTEPAEWHYPPRHALGAVLLEAKRPAEAETVYWEDLKRNRENGWALFGLAQALRTQGKNEEAALAEALRAANNQHTAEVERLQQELAEAQAASVRAISQAQITRAGYVYVNSNIGSFGDCVFKIGMTRQLEPMDRVGVSPAM